MAQSIALAADASRLTSLSPATSQQLRPRRASRVASRGAGAAIIDRRFAGPKHES
jgi:hypothetical protein